MKVILTAEVQGKGGEGDVIDVARGFANNYLIPQGFAILATKGNLKQLEQRKNQIAKREEKRIADAAASKETLESAPVFVAAQVGDEGQLFGSVTSAMIAQAISDKFGIEIDKRRVELKAPLKTAGEFDVSVCLYRSTKANVKVLVAAQEPAAQESVEEASAVSEPTESSEQASTAE